MKKEVNQINFECDEHARQRGVRGTMQGVRGMRGVRGIAISLIFTFTLSLKKYGGIISWLIDSCQTRRPLTSVTWPYRGLKCRTHRGYVFF